MSEQKTKAEVAELLLKTADSLSGLADSVRALCASLADSPQTEAKEGYLPSVPYPADRNAETDGQRQV